MAVVLTDAPSGYTPTLKDDGLVVLRRGRTLTQEQKSDLLAFATPTTDEEAMFLSRVASCQQWYL